MGLKGKLTVEKEIKCNGDIFYNLFRYKPYDIANITPNHYNGFHVQEGQLGSVGCVYTREYTLEGKKKAMKIVVEAIDEEKKQLKFKAVEGDILELYKEYSVRIRVDSKGDEHVVIWTLEYVKVKEDVVDPTSYLELAINVTLDVEDYYAN